MYFVVRFLPSDISTIVSGSELKDGDTVIFKGEEPLTKPEFYKIADNLLKKDVDFIIETLGVTFNDYDNIKYLFSRYNIKEVLIKIFSLNSSVNDRFMSHTGITTKTLLGLGRLIQTGFKSISIITYLGEDEFLSRIRSLYEFKKQNGLKNLYIEFDSRLPFERKSSALKELYERFKGAEDIIVRNNDFDIKLSYSDNNDVEIKVDLERGILNLVLRTFCSNNCPFCTTRIVQSAYNSPLPFDPFSEIQRSIQKNASQMSKRELFEIVAVEPLEHPDILGILAYARKIGFDKIRLLTHGRLLKDKAFFNELKRLNVKEIIIPITFYSPESATINVGDKNAYFDIEKAIENIIKQKTIHFVFNIIISKQNYKEIDKIVEWLESKGITDYNFTLSLPSIEDKRFYKPYAVRFTDLLRVIGELDLSLKERILNSLAYIIAPCLVFEFCDKKLIDKIKREYKKTKSDALASKREFSKYKSTIRCKKSYRCSLSDFCPGVNKVYIETFGEKEFKIVR